jgi:hypothetical protein
MATQWNPPVELSEQEARIMKRVKKAPLFRFFREHRHQLLDAATQAKLVAAYPAVERGKKPMPPGQMALAMLMQAAFGVSDQEVVELTACDRRWQMCLDCLDNEEPLFCQGTVFNYRLRAIEHKLVPVLIERSVQLAKETKKYSAAALRAALDSSPLWGAGRVEDTFNLIARAATLVVRSAAERLGKTAVEVAELAGIPLATASSVKAALDLDWSNKGAKTQGLRTLLGQVDALTKWLAVEMAEACKEPPLDAQLSTLKQVCEQDVEPDPDDGGPRIKQGVAPDRRISIHDPDMRHGRKSKSKRFDGYKQHVINDLDIPGLIRGGLCTPANKPEADAATSLIEQVERQGDPLGELHVDRAYVGSEPVRERPDLKLVAKPHPVQNQGRLTKEDFSLDFAAMTIRCPGDVTMPMQLGAIVEFPVDRCAACPMREQCTTSKNAGRSVRISDTEPLQARLRSVQKTSDGRHSYRERVAVEHSLARIAQIKGVRARYRGLEKNTFDLGRSIVVNNCYVLDGLWRDAA